MASGGVKILRMFLVMLKIGFLTFGGGYVMIPMMQRDFVEKYRWASREEVADMFAVAQSAPGVIAVNASVLIGHRIAGTAGSLVAAFGVVLPSYLTLIAVTLFYNVFAANPYVLGALRGVRPAVCALMLSYVADFGRLAMPDLPGWLIFIPALLLSLFVPEAHAAILILAGGLIGYAVYRSRLKRGGDGLR